MLDGVRHSLMKTSLSASFSVHSGAGGFFPFPFFGSEATDSRAEESVPPGTAPVPTGASVPPDFRPSDDAGGGIGGMVAGTAMAEAMHGGMDRGESKKDAFSFCCVGYLSCLMRACPASRMLLPATRRHEGCCRSLHQCGP
jgi:hypothetical protein